MRLNVFTDHALRVLMYAAARTGERCTSEEVAVSFDISRHHVVKVVNELQHLGFIDTVRGRTGGFALSRPAADIRIGDIVRGTEGTLALVECFDREKADCPLLPACELRGVLREAFDAFFAVLDRHSLADLVAEPELLARVTALVQVTRASRQH